MEKVLKINVPEGYEVDKEKSTFESIVFRVLPEKKLPESWEELGKISGCFIASDSNVCSIYGDGLLSTCDETVRNTWPTREEAEASIALAQLLQLRDRYNGDWRPDWIRDDTKYTIIIGSNKVMDDTNYRVHRLLCFRTEELRDKFLSCPEIRKLIEIAKPLL